MHCTRTRTHARMDTHTHIQTRSGIKLEPLEGAGLTDQSDGDASSSGGGSDSVDVEALSNNTNGVVFFNGGSYSAGPDFIGKAGALHDGRVGPLPCRGKAVFPHCNSLLGQRDGCGESHQSCGHSKAFPNAQWLTQVSIVAAVAAPAAGPPTYKILQDEGPSSEDEAQASGEASGQERGREAEDAGEEVPSTASAPGSISIMESCLVDWASKSRVRLKVTVRITHDPDNGEAELDVLRVLLFREAWVGQVGVPAADVRATVQESGMDKVRIHVRVFTHVWADARGANVSMRA